jgi:hypothetical protein
MNAPQRMSFEEAAEGLQRGDFSRLAPLFGDVEHPEQAKGLIVEWLDAGAFEGHVEMLAEALTCACWLGQVGVASRLLDAGADPGAGTATGMSALHWAANRGQREAVELLLAHGAPTEQRNMYAGTVLGTAVWSALNEPRGDQLGSIRVLLSAGANAAVVEYPTGHDAVDALLASHR